MDRLSELMEILGRNLSMNNARLDCFARMLLALFAVRTINLSEIKKLVLREYSLEAQKALKPVQFFIP